MRNSIRKVENHWSTRSMKCIVMHLFWMTRDHREGKDGEEVQEIPPGTCWPTVMASPLTLHESSRIK